MLLIFIIRKISDLRRRLTALYDKIEEMKALKIETNSLDKESEKNNIFLEK